ncbi:HalOD1 output domain-containing protein [Haloarchaeobius amylolyticus]|uniref:HalOD1 output domain-containing protein n=1 Tax=Haloarchaeobius amylolyticus TaxID=1198296 RepID=A0ABD6BKF4_9EURY
MSGATLDYHSDSISLRVVEALADATDTTPSELEPLYNSIDPEALDQLFQPGFSDEIRVTFEYGTSQVEVRGDGTVMVDGTVHDSE